MIGMPLEENRYGIYQEIQYNERSWEKSRFEKKKNKVEQRECGILNLKVLEMPVPSPSPSPPPVISNWKNELEFESVSQIRRTTFDCSSKGETRI